MILSATAINGTHAMRIWLAVSYEPIPGLDGDARWLRYGTLANMLAGAGHDVTLWTGAFDHVRKRERTSTSACVPSGPGLTIHLLNAKGYTHNKSLSRWRYNRELGRQFAQEAKRDAPPDLIFACLHPPDFAEKVIEFAKQRRTRVIVDVVDRWPDVYLTAFPRVVRGAVKLALALEYARSRRVLQAANSITAASKTYLDWALDLARRRGTADDQVFELGYPEVSAEMSGSVAALPEEVVQRAGMCDNALIVIFLGMFAGSYDLETVVGAARILEQRGRRDVQIILAGAGDKDDRLRALARGLSSVSFTGWIGHSESIALLRLADAGLASYSRESLQSLPNKPFEYMAHGLAMLSSLPGELDSLVESEKIGRVYEPGNPEALAKVLSELADDRAGVARMGDRARKLFERQYSQPSIYARLMRHVLATAVQSRSSSVR